MKKLLLAILIVLFTASFVYAEIGAQTYTGNKNTNWREQTVFIDCYNNGATAIASDAVVILDTTATSITSGTTLGTYVTTTTTAYDTRVLGVTDGVINAGSVGRVCVRGPHKVYLTGAPGAVGATLSTTTTAGYGVAAGSTTNAAGGGVFGIALTTTQTNPESGDASTGTNKYWAWIGHNGAN